VNSGQDIWFWLVDGSHALLDLMSAGGTVMWLLAGLCVLFWTLVLERLWYAHRHFPVWAQERKILWQKLTEQVLEGRGWHYRVRAAWLAQAREQLLIPLSVTRTLVALFPLLGLLGTVTGMIAVFDVLASTSGANPRAMAGGVWQATLPTLAGMVLAIGGLFSLARLERNAQRAIGHFAEQLRHE